MVLAPLVSFGLKRTRWGLIVRTVGESAEAARAMGYDVNRVRTLATMAGGFLAGIGARSCPCFTQGVGTRGCRAGKG